jgi:hypothetical protein
MKEVFTRAGVEVTKENKKEIDRIIHSIVGVEYKNCSATWRVVFESFIVELFSSGARW